MPLPSVAEFNMSAFVSVPCLFPRGQKTFHWNARGCPRWTPVASLRPTLNADRNTGVLSAAAAAAAAAALVLSASPDAALSYGLTRDGRLEKCKGNEACVSTSSVSNPSKFGPPWTYEPETSSAVDAWASFKTALTKIKDKGTIVEAIDGPEQFYLRAEFPSFLKGIDDVEFKLVPADNMVTVRSCSREAIFVYPLQTPIDNGKNKARLKEIRTFLGWGELDGDIMSVASPEPQPAPDFLPDFE